MNIKKALVSCLVAMSFLSVSAQENKAKTEYVFNPHWNVQYQVGGQYTLGEISFGDLLSPNMQIGVGYNFSPVVGARLAVNAWQSKAGWEMGDASYDWKWNYIAPNVDLTFNLSNLFCGYNPKRLFNFSAFAGLGLNVAWGNDDAANAKRAIDIYYNVDGANQNLAYLWDGTKVRVQGQFGVMADFRVSDKVSVGLELSANTVGDRYNSKRAGNGDWYFNALAGVKVNLGKTHTTRTIEPCKPVERVVEKVIERVVEKPVPVAPTAAVQEVAKVEPLRRDIFFTISSTKIVKDEMAKVAEIADYLTKYPNAKVAITGYADKGTGNARINSSLAAKRAKAVVDALINNYGISASRITSDSKGDTVQPFAEEIKNRVSICIAK